MGMTCRPWTTAASAALSFGTSRPILPSAFARSATGNTPFTDRTRSVKEALPIALRRASGDGSTRLLVPKDPAAEAVVNSLQVIPILNLREAVSGFQKGIRTPYRKVDVPALINLTGKCSSQERCQPQRRSGATFSSGPDFSFAP